MIFYVCYKFPNILKDRWCCIIINTVFCIHTAIHIHTMIYVLTAGHWIMFIFSFLYTILFEIEALVSEDDCHVGFVGLDDIRQRNEFTRNVQHCLLHIVFFFVLFSCSAYMWVLFGFQWLLAADEYLFNVFQNTLWTSNRKFQCGNEGIRIFILHSSCSGNISSFLIFL